MDTDRKAFNSTLRPVSKKRQAEGRSYGLKRTRLKPISKKQTQKIKTYRDIAFARWGKRCIVCGTTEGIQVHHFNCNRYDNRPENLFPLCLAHHNHMGAEGLKEVNNRILTATRKIV